MFLYQIQSNKIATQSSWSIDYMEKYQRIRTTISTKQARTGEILSWIPQAFLTSSVILKWWKELWKKFQKQPRRLFER